MTPHDIIRRPIETEKGTALREKTNVYLFEVHKSANKVEIKNAIEKLFGVHVNSVRTVVTHGKVVRRGLNMGMRNRIKKAYVALKEGEKIALFEGA